MFKHDSCNLTKSFSINNFIPTISLHNTVIDTVADSGTTEFLLRESDTSNLVVNRSAPSLSVQLPNEQIIHSVGTTQLVLADKQLTVTAFVFPNNVLSHNLFSLSAVCNLGCTVTLTRDDITIIFNSTTIMHATKSELAKLWTLQINSGVLHPPAPRSNVFRPSASTTSVPNPYAPNSANLVIRHETDADMVRFYHAVFGSPPHSTFYNAVNKGYLREVPSLTAKKVAANPVNSMATAKGHLELARQGQRSSKLVDSLSEVPSALPIDIDSISVTDSSTDYDSNDDNVVFIKLVAISQMNYSDLTARFPVTSISGMQYLLISILDGYIHIELMKSKSATEYVRAFKATYSFFKQRGRQPTFQRLDNEKSGQLDAFFASEGITVQFLPTNNHRANRAEGAIKHAKNHFISVLCGTHPDFPILFWDRLIPQAEITLNHLRPCAYRIAMSAYEAMFGAPYDFSSHPMAPPGIRVLVFDPPQHRASWAPHGEDGFYTGPALGHFRSYNVVVRRTQSDRITDTLAWFPVPYSMPGATPIEQLNATMTDATTILQTIATSDSVLAVNRQPFQDKLTVAADAIRQLLTMYVPSSLVVDDSLGVQIPKATHQRQPAAAAAAAPVAASAQQQRVPEQRVLIEAFAPAAVFPLAPPAPIAQISPVGHAANQRASVDPFPPPAVIISSNTSTSPRPVKTKQAKASTPYSTTTRSAARRAHTTNNAVAFSAVSRTSATEPLQPPLSIQSPVYPQSVEWLESSDDTFALDDAFISTQALNLQADGQPITYQTVTTGPDKALWRIEESVELDRLIGKSKTLRPIHRSAQPSDRRKDTTYYNPQPREKESASGVITRRIRGTAGGNLIHYPGDVSARTAEMEVVKILLNCVASENAHWMTVDISDYYLNTTLKRPEYIRISLKHIPDDIMLKYNLSSYVYNNSVLFEITKGMYGLPQAGLLAQDELVQHLELHEYIQSPKVPCLFRHKTRSTAFSLVVDDFGIKFATQTDADHLLDTLRKKYAITVDQTGSKYLGFTIKHNRAKRNITLSMPSYIPKLLQRFAPNIKKGAASPGVYIPPSYGAHVQYNTYDNAVPTSPSPQAITRIQEIVGCFLYYARGLDSTMLTIVNDIASQQAHPTTALDNAIDRLLAYAAAYPNNELVFSASDMIMYIQSDASYLSRLGVHSVAGGVYYLGNKDSPTEVNGAIHTLSNAINVIVASAAEAEYAALFLNAQKGEWLRLILSEVGYPQAATLILCDNACAVGIANDSVKLKRSKSMDMRFHWIRDRIRQGHFTVQWRAGAHNLADFFTKILPVKLHQDLMRFLVHTPVNVNSRFHNRNTPRIKKPRADKI